MGLAIISTFHDNIFSANLKPFSQHFYISKGAYADITLNKRFYVEKLKLFTI
jgi:hypothetical protein